MTREDRMDRNKYRLIEDRKNRGEIKNRGNITAVLCEKIMKWRKKWIKKKKKWIN